MASQQFPNATCESVDYILIDYLQLIDWEGQTTCEEQLIYLTKKLKQIAVDYDVTIIAFCQVSRLQKPYNLANIRPNLSNLRIEGLSEFDDINISFIVRPEYYHIYEEYAFGHKVEGKMEFITYNEEGCKVSLLHFDKDTTRVSNWLA